MKSKNGRKKGKRFYAIVDNKDNVLKLYRLKKMAINEVSVIGLYSNREVVPATITIIRNKGKIKR